MEALNCVLKKSQNFMNPRVAANEKGLTFVCMHNIICMYIHL